jgi:hypothetical protein
MVLGVASRQAKYSSQVDKGVDEAQQRTGAGDTQQ